MTNSGLARGPIWNALPYSQVSGIETVDLNGFVDRVTAIARQLGYRAYAPQIRECLGSIANLYLAKAIAINTGELSTVTTRGVASELVPMSKILREMQYSAGSSRQNTELLLRAIERGIAVEFENRGMQSGIELYVPPLGTLKLVDGPSASYMLTYRDPASDYHSVYLHS